MGAVTRYRIERWRRSRFWAVYADDELIAVVVYLRGARELVQRLAGR